MKHLKLKDENNNSLTIEFVRLHLEKYSIAQNDVNELFSTLKYCVDCVDCVDCVSCVSCTDCKDCKNCVSCTDCISCTDCMYCESCENLQVAVSQNVSQIKGCSM